MKSNLFILTTALLLVAGSADAANIYANNITALNINMLTDTFMSYANYSTKISDLFKYKSMYGIMDRFDEYGDDGSTLKQSLDSGKVSTAFSNIWINANHINGDIHYGHNITKHSKLNLASVGVTTKAINVGNGNMSFGGFVSYINSKNPDTHANGDAFGIYSHYKYKRFDSILLLNAGSLNNDINTVRYNNSWANIAAKASLTFKIDDTFFVRPNLYAGYNFVSSSDLRIDTYTVSSKDYNFINVAPGLTFIKEISHGWYGGLSGKYVAHFGGKNDIVVNNIASEGLYIDNHTDIAIDLEHNFKQFVFGANIHKQLGGIDGWSGNINVKYAF